LQRVHAGRQQLTEEREVAGSNGEVSRREAMRALLTALPVAAVAGSGRSPSPVQVPSDGSSQLQAGGESAASSGPPSRSHGPPPGAFDDLPGTKVGRCTVVRVDPVLAGAIPVTLAAADGTEFKVDVLRHDGETPGVAQGGSLAVFMHNGGSGGKATVEEHGLGAMALAGWLERREALGRPVPVLATLRQRALLLAAADV
jgi:hypothetical protein